MIGLLKRPDVICCESLLHLGLLVIMYSAAYCW